MMENRYPTDDAAGGGAAHPIEQDGPPPNTERAGPGPYTPSPQRFQQGQWRPQLNYYQQHEQQHQQQWQTAGPPSPWPKHEEVDASSAYDRYPQAQPQPRPFRLQNPPPPGQMRPSGSRRPVLQLRSDGSDVPPDLASPRSDSFFYSSRPTRPCPSPTPTISYYQPVHRTRAESSPTHRPPRSAFPGLSSNPFIPESPESASSPTHSRKFPSFARQHDPLARLSPGPNSNSPAESRQGTPTEPSMVVENFSRPRKTSVRSQQSDSALSRRMVTPHRLQAEPPLADQPPPTSSTQAPASFNSASNPWTGNRRLSGSSSQSTSTFSSAPHRSSNDRLDGTPRIDHSRYAISTTTAAAPFASARPPPTHYNPNSPSTHLREPTPWLATGDELRSSFRSQLTASTAQGTVSTASGTERNSILTKDSSFTEQSIINGYARRSWRANSIDDGPSLEDVMGMYERGFNDSDIESVRRSMRFAEDDDIPDADHDFEIPEPKGASRPASGHSDTGGLEAKMLEAMSDSLPIPQALPVPEAELQGGRRSRTRRSLLPSSLPNDIGLGFTIEQAPRRDKPESDTSEKHDSAKMLDGDDGPVVARDGANSQPPTPTSPTSPNSTTSPTPTQAHPVDNTTPPLGETPVPPAPVNIPALPQEPPEEPGSRDRYGFRKASANVTRQAYDAWDATYTEYLARRRKKWVAFLKDNSLMTDRPNRFPQRSAKAKRFIRKGIPPDWRGAAWFYYAGGPAIVSKHRGVYEQLVRRAGLDLGGTDGTRDPAGEVKPLIIEDIEKDLYRTFPDNIRFKPPRTTTETPTAQTNPAQPAAEPEIITSLRRVLNAFALYNPRIGYCQSLNFLAGLLLLFVETEEQAFWLLNIITRVYLPGTHEMSLEGSKVDLGVLMLAMKDSMPAVWKQIGGDELEAGKKTKGRLGYKLGHGNNPGSISDPNRLPAITLCMTAWFMSCFIGTLPIETVLRVWDVFFYEGSRTLFRIALTIFKLGEREIKAVQDPMEMFGVVQTFPRRMVDCNTLIETCYKRRNGIGHLSQEAVEEKRQERRDGIRKWKAEQEAAASDTSNNADHNYNSPRPSTKQRFGAGALGLDLAADLDDVRRKANLFGRKKDQREQARATEVA
ncbi:hypothetical protein B0J18DRAFT_34192 [Chaetomium sp. MPI-SDFR-AT-0129]|nr:hypothetical protein B0J18DRAFT_34192 [Chaetomium sp. MPI-SDFR-AT-0129]